MDAICCFAILATATSMAKGCSDSSGRTTPGHIIMQGNDDVVGACCIVSTLGTTIPAAMLQEQGADQIVTDFLYGCGDG